MKKKLFVAFFALCVTHISAQDVIVKKDGSTILSKVIEVNNSDVKYKKHSNPKGPTYTIAKSKILAINYQNGDKDTFDDQQSEYVSSSQVSDNSGSSRLVKKKAASNNADLIASYNTQITQKAPMKKNTAEYCNVYFAVASNSILANEDIEVSFHQNNEVVNVSSFGFDIEIKNKSNRTIYIDKGNCFRVINEVDAYCYYNASEQTTVGRSSESGVSLGLGSVAGVLGIGGVAGQLASGISVGGGSSRSASTTFIAQRVIAIPPHSKKKLCDNKVLILSNKWRKTIDPNENFFTYDYGSRNDGSWCYRYRYASQFGLYMGDVKLGEIISYNEHNSPHHRVYMLTYSKDENFNTYSVVNFTLYAQHVIGVKWTQKGMDNVNINLNESTIYCNRAKLQKR